MLKTIDRYILKELIDPFLFGLCAFTAILSASLIMFDLVRAVVITGMPLLKAGQIFLYRIPSVVIYIFPMATLLGTLLAFGRLSADREITALKASGVSLQRIILPVLVFGFGVSIITMLFYEVVVPTTNRASQAVTLSARTEVSPKLKENILIPDIEKGQMKRVLFARALQDNVLQGVIVQEFSEGHLTQLINAKTARWEDEAWKFFDGIIYLLSEDGEYKHLIRFAEQELAIKYSPQELAEGEKKAEDLRISELREYIKLKKKMGVDVTELEIQMNMKLSLPFACLVFALLGAPLGLRPQRSGSSLGLGLSILIIFLYYIIMFFSMAAGQLQLISPALAAWLPNLLTGAIGVYILNAKAQ